MEAALQNIIATGQANALLVISAEDLSAFAEMLISRTRQIVKQYSTSFYYRWNISC